MNRKSLFIFLSVLFMGGLIHPLRLKAQNSTGRITGIVKNHINQPLRSATVELIKNGKVIGNYVTDSLGKFVFEQLDPGSYDFEFSSVGFKSQSLTGYLVKEGQTTSILVSMDLSEGSLSEVVVTALGVSKTKARLGYAVTTVDGGLLNQAKEPNVAYSLEGRVAGLSINGVNGGPGSSARMLIRGISNFTSTTGPLIVINGVPMDNTNQGSAGTWGGSDMGDGISSINPDDVEEVTVLKGSTASALYGSRASNGVVLITTKGGKGAKGIGVEFSSNFNVNHIVDNSDFQKIYGAGQYGVKPQTIQDLTNDDLNSWGAKFDGSPSIEQDGLMHPYSPVSHPRNQFYRTAPVVTNTVSFNGGGKEGNMRLSLAQTDNESVMPNSNLVRYSANLSLNQNITKRLKLTMMDNFINETAKMRPYLNDFSRNANFIVQFIPINIDPRYYKPGFDPITGAEKVVDQTGYYGNPWFEATKLMNTTTRNRLLSSTVLKYSFTNELYLQTRLGIDYIVDGLFQAEPTGWGIVPQGKLEDQMKKETTEMNADLLLAYNHRFTDILALNATAGGNIRKYKSERVGFNNQNFVVPFLYSITNSNGLGYDYQYSKQQTNSGYYNIDLDISNYLSLSTTGRYDVFSTLPAGNRGIFTPSVSASFLFHDLINWPKLNFGKLRMSYAQTSGEALPYHTELTYAPLGAIGGISYGAPQSFVFNPSNIKPYRMTEYETGIELKFFNNRLGLNATYFNRKTEGELISEPISQSTGFSSSYFPIGSTSNKGLEFELSLTPIKSRNITWNANFNFTYVENKLVSLGDTSKLGFVELDQYRPANGGTVWAGDGSFTANVQGLPLSQIMVNDYARDSKGNIIVQNGIPIQGPLKPAGSGLPKIYGGLNNEFVYKRFTLSFLIDFRFKVNVESGTNFISTYYGLNKSTLAGRENGVLIKGVNQDGSPNSTTVDAQTYYQTLVNNVSIMEVFDASFIKLRQMTLGYDFNSNAIRQHSPFQSIRVSLVGRNLLTLLKHTTNFDPEDNYSALPIDAGLEGGSLPQVRTMGINLNFKFKN